MQKTGSIQDYIKTHVDASPAIVQGMAFTAAMKGQKFNAYVKKTFGGDNGKGPSQKISCYNRGKTGHLQKDYIKLKGSNKKGPPGPCPRYKKGKH